MVSLYVSCYNINKFVLHDLMIKADSLMGCN